MRTPVPRSRTCLCFDALEGHIASEPCLDVVGGRKDDISIMYGIETAVSAEEPCAEMMHCSSGRRFSLATSSVL